MKNTTFLAMSEKHQQQKLRAILRSQTNYALSELEINTLIKSTKRGRQFGICIYTDPRRFCRRVGSAVGKTSTFQYAFGQIQIDWLVNGHISVELPQTDLCAGAVTYNACARPRAVKYGGSIHVYVPPELFAKGT